MSGPTPKGEIDPKLWVWGVHDTRPRFLHTAFRVKDLDATLRFYIDGLGMRLLDERFDVPARRVTAAFIGFDDYAAGGCLELVHVWDAKDAYTHGTGYGHISIGVPDINGMLAKLTSMGGEVVVAPTVLIAGGPQVAYLKDLDGYTVELLQTRHE
jgi:lactoylglutathione lyase